MTNGAGFRAAHAGGEDWRKAAAEAVGALGTLAPEHRLGFLYVTDSYAAEFEDIVAFLRQATGVQHWVGTVGFGVCATQREYFDEPALAVMIAALPEDAFRVFSGVVSDIGPVADRHGGWISSHPPLAVVHADPRNQQVPRLIHELAEATNGFLVGGLTASRGPVVQVADEVGEGGLSGVMLALQAVPVAAGLTQGCTPIGPVRTVTSAEENILLEIDGRPALDVFKEDIGELLARDLNRVAGYIFAGLPVTGSDTGDYLVRNLVGIDPQHGAVAIGEYVDAGDTIMFCRRDHGSAVEDMRRMLADLKRRTGSSPIRGALYFSCCGRGPNQFGQDSRELRIIAEELGDFPLVGFFANGEINHDRLYGYTGVLTLFL